MICSIGHWSVLGHIRGEKYKVIKIGEFYRITPKSTRNQSAPNPMLLPVMLGLSLEINEDRWNRERLLLRY